MLKKLSRWCTLIWALGENLISLHANNKSADQTVLSHSLISAIVIRSLESIVSKLASGKLSIFGLVSVLEQFGLSLTQSETPKTGFLAMKPIFG